jgi:molybdenum cofactor cytidylyltransferase
MKPPPAAHSSALGVVILAAGASRRMGKAKLLLPWGNTTVLGHLLAQWQALGAAQIAVVCAAGNLDMGKELDRLNVPAADRIINPDPERGMFSSVQCAAQWRGWRPGLTHWAIVLGDQPHVRRQTLQQVLDFSLGHLAEVCQPARRGHGRHPVLLPEAVFRQVASSTAATLKEFLASAAGQIALCELDDAGLDLDIDRPEDYEQALKSAGISLSLPGSFC